MFKYELKHKGKLVRTWYQQDAPTSEQIHIYKPRNEEGWTYRRSFCPKHEAVIGKWQEFRELGQQDFVNHVYPEVNERYKSFTIEKKLEYLVRHTIWRTLRKLKYWAVRHVALKFK